MNSKKDFKQKLGMIFTPFKRLTNKISSAIEAHNQKPPTKFGMFMSKFSEVFEKYAVFTHIAVGLIMVFCLVFSLFAEAMAEPKWEITEQTKAETNEKKKSGNTAPAVKKEQLYRELVQAGDNLMQRIRELEGHSNAEIKSLTAKIRSLMK